jgi:hypothetical protein
VLPLRETPDDVLATSFGVTVPTAQRRFTHSIKAGLRRMHRAVLDGLGSQELIAKPMALCVGVVRTESNHLRIR